MALILSLTPAVFASDGAVWSERGLRADGKKVSCEVYDISGEYYFKLRDIAMVLRNSGSRFSVDWDGEQRAVRLTTGESYEPIGGEGDLSGGDRGATAVPSTQTLFIDGVESELRAYNIGGSNYFRLEDLGEALGFRTDYDEESDTAILRTKALFPRNITLGPTYTDKLSDSVITCWVTFDPSPWLVQEVITTTNDGRYSRETTTYGEDGRMLSVTSEGLNFTTMDFHYDELGRETERVQSILYASGQESSSVLFSEYDIWGQMVRRASDGKEDITVFTYDDRGNQTAMERVMDTPAGTWTTGQYMEYDEDGNRVKLVSVQNGETTGSYEYTYDADGNVLREEVFGPAGNRLSLAEASYEDGRLTKEVRDDGINRVTTTFVYEETGITTVTVTESPMRNVQTTIRSDTEGKPLSRESTDGERSSVTTYIYDEAGRLVRQETGDPEAPSHVTAITYDENGNLLCVVYENGGYREEDTLEYDPSARKVTHTKTTTYPEASEIVLSNDSLSLPVGGMSMLMASFLPGNALQETVTWSSSDENVVTVNHAGFVSAVGPGVATVTADTQRGLKANCTITVTEAQG